MGQASTPPKESTKTYKNVDVIYGGNQIVLPDGMSFKDGREWLRRKEEEELKEVAFSEDISGAYPLDALVAFNKALAEIYGWVDLRPTPGFFRDEPPMMISIPVSDTDSMQVPFGRFAIPNVDGWLQTQIQFPKGKRPTFQVMGQTRQRCVAKLKEICMKTREVLMTESIYKGKAWRISWEWQRRGRNFDFNEDSPRFMTLEDIKPEDLIFSDEVQQQLAIGLFTPIEYAKECRAAKAPIKRGVLLEGPYGTGKTLAAQVAAKKAQDNGFTFIYLNDVSDLKNGVELARYYAPAIVFAEDVDKIIGTQERTDQVNEILNTMDGIESKHHEVLTVFTTNHVGRLNRAFIRPGRLDTVVSVRPPDAEAASRLVELYGRGMLADDADKRVIGRRLQGKIPAVIREIVERAKLATVWRLRGEKEIMGEVNDKDIVNAATAIEAHEALLTSKAREPEFFTIEQMRFQLDHWTHEHRQPDIGEVDENEDA